jgi:hypothetical protein
MYADVTVVVDGAVDSEERFYDYALMDEFIRSVEEDAKADSYPTEVYIVYHEHKETEDECSCVQYLTDHHPAYTFNMEEN